jgi:hypothetical protein
MPSLSQIHVEHSFLTLYRRGTHRFNQAKPKTEVEARVYEVLSHKNWGASSTIMNEIARDTYDYDKCKFKTTSFPGRTCELLQLTRVDTIQSGPLLVLCGSPWKISGQQLGVLFLRV